MNEQPKLAVLIDAENVSNKYVKLIMDEVSNYGVATYKRVYGDYSNPSVSMETGRARRIPAGKTNC